jgi:hypothetical protein
MLSEMLKESWQYRKEYSLMVLKSMVVFIVGIIALVVITDW